MFKRRGHDGGSVLAMVGTHADQDHRAVELALLGSRDPADVQAATPDLVHGLVSAAGDRLTTCPTAGEWSAAEVVSHLLHTEVLYAARYRWILAQDAPVAVGYDPDSWVTTLHRREPDTQASVTLFRLLREANVRLWRTTDPAERQRVAKHEQRGEESLETSFRMVAGHDLRHLEQIRDALGG